MSSACVKLVWWPLNCFTIEQMNPSLIINFNKYLIKF